MIDCNFCRGRGWVFDMFHGWECCVDCNDDHRIPLPELD